MRFYEVTNGEDGGGRFFGTQSDAHDAAKACQRRAHVFIDEVEVPTDKAGLLSVLNSPSTARFFPTLRTWRLTARGGMEDTATRGTEPEVCEEGPVAGGYVPVAASPVLLGDWSRAAARFNMDEDQYPRDDAMKRVVISAYYRLLASEDVL